MAKPDYRLCDICGEKTTATPIFAATDRVRDPSGNGYETEGSSFDLCQCHLVGAITILLNSPSNSRVHDYEAGKRIVEWVRKCQYKK